LQIRRTEAVQDDQIESTKVAGEHGKAGKCCSREINLEPLSHLEINDPGYRIVGATCGVGGNCQGAAVAWARNIQERQRNGATEEKGPSGSSHANNRSHSGAPAPSAAADFVDNRYHDHGSIDQARSTNRIFELALGAGNVTRETNLAIAPAQIVALTQAASVSG
jgi:hypothetical protein